ncbi:MAG TPA: transposase [Candidatus Bathyarchaeia archaeon]|nr:transposase [Candidatus Bathyarchaeia archaeon]
MLTLKNSNRLTKKVSKQLIEDLTQEEISKVLEQINNTKSKKMLLTFQQKIFPTLEQAEVLYALSENCRLLYNFALKERIEWWEKNKDKTKKERETFPSYINQQNNLPKIKEQYSRYKQVHSKTLQMTLRQLDADFKSFLALRKKGHSEAQPPKFKGKKYFTPIIYNQSGFKIKGNMIRFNHFYPTKETKETELYFQLENRFNPINRNIKQVLISQNYKTKEFNLSITFEEPTPIYQDNGLYQAIDQGVMSIVAGVNNHAGKTIIIKNQRVDKYWQPKIEELTSKRDYCKKYSNKWHWYNEKLKKIIRKQSNQQKDFQHKVSKKIVENTKADTLIIGDLNTRQMSQKRIGDKKNRKSLHRSNHNSGVIGRFARFLTYKAEKVGKKVIRISERRTSMRCCYCGKKEQRWLSERIIKCDKCGIVIDRDINASVNIMQRFFALLSLSHKRPLVGQQLLSDFRKLFFATHSQTSNGSFSSNGVGRTRKKSYR